MMIQACKQLFFKVYYHPFIRFCFVGAVGLMTDAVFLYALRHVIGLIPAKLVSYIIALSVNWLLNRAITFQSNDSRRFREWMRFGLVYGVTGFMHMGIFAFLVHEYPAFYNQPLGALIITAVAVVFFNYVLTKCFAFKKIEA